MAIPAPARFTDLKQHLHEAGIDATYLCLKLEEYLNQPDNMPQTEWFLDPTDDHHAWAFREVIQEFQQMIVDKEDEDSREI